ncbi:PxKF domain-containing protein [Acidobacteria bacterium AH-259-A15]|nr:PxKF domain-containing protein [Acidobacteria bacterium AH-259-A15]
MTLSTSEVGPHTITASYPSSDVHTFSSGSADLTVTYNFSGFLTPLGPANKTFQIGNTVPIKWQLTDAKGSSFINNLETVVSLKAVLLNSTDDPIAISVLVAPDQAPSSTDLRYDTARDQYIFNWDTTGRSPGPYRIELALDDGTQHTASLRLK